MRRGKREWGGARARLQPLRGVLLDGPADAAGALLGRLLDAERVVPSVDEEVGVAHAHQVAPALRVARVLAQPRLLGRDELAAVDGDQLVLRKVDLRKEAAPDRVVADHRGHARGAHLDLAVGQRREVLPHLLVRLGRHAAQHQQLLHRAERLHHLQPLLLGLAALLPALLAVVVVLAGRAERRRPARAAGPAAAHAVADLDLERRWLGRRRRQRRRQQWRLCRCSADTGAVLGRSGRADAVGLLLDLARGCLALLRRAAGGRLLGRRRGALGALSSWSLRRRAALVAGAIGLRLLALALRRSGQRVEIEREQLLEAAHCVSAAQKGMRRRNGAAATAPSKQSSRRLRTWRVQRGGLWDEVISLAGVGQCVCRRLCALRFAADLARALGGRPS